LAIGQEFGALALVFVAAPALDYVKDLLTQPAA